MRGGSLEEFTRGMFFVDECRVWVSPELRGREEGKRFNTEGTEEPQSSQRRRDSEKRARFIVPLHPVGF
jgi:hypothetical protein